MDSNRQLVNKTTGMNTHYSFLFYSTNFFLVHKQKKFYVTESVDFLFNPTRCLTIVTVVRIPFKLDTRPVENENERFTDSQ